MSKSAKKRVARKQSVRAKRTRVDPIGASKDGHQFHEAWLARRSLGLILSHDGLCGIAVEGLSEDIEENAPAEAIEIADATFFYGQQPTFAKADRIDVTQFKYSVARGQTPMRFSDAKKTLTKFAIAEAAFIRRHGAALTREKFRYTLFTNRPISNDLQNALTLARNASGPLTNGAKEQYEQLHAAIRLRGKALTAFLERVNLVGGSDKLAHVERGTEQIIADWSASSDIMARARIGDLRKVVRDKNGAAGQNDKLVTKVDVLAALGQAHEEDLLPTPDAFVAVGDIVRRSQLTSFLERLGSTGRWLVHAEGGIGKTVFVQSVAGQLGATDEIVLFDCFGGGAYRNPIDERHRPERGLMHIVNELACRGLCDPILPGSTEPNEVIRRAIERFRQALVSLRRTRPAARLVIIMDAADNAADEARNRNQPAFPKVLLQSLTHQPSIDGLVVIATARPERLELAVGTAQCELFKIEPFNLDEASTFVLSRRPEATPAQIAALHSRSDGNPRVLANLIEPDRALSGNIQCGEKVRLESLIEDRIERAIKLADTKGAKAGAIDGFLCALGVLPPPVPVDEMALAFGLSKEEVSSLAADLSPLLERTKHGLIFRDEPTETLIKRKYTSRLSLMDNVVTRLTEAQNTSVYAARALPLLLSAMGRVDDLRRLAFDTRFPPELNSDVPKRAIRFIRVKMALGAATKVRDFDATTDLLVELSALALVNERGDQYLANNPDLVVGLADSESLRRLFEMKLGWPGERHARLAVAYTLDRDVGTAYGHAVRADEWLRWSYNQNDHNIRAHRADEDVHIAIPFYLAVEGRQSNAAGYIGQFKSNFGYKLSTKLLSLLSMANTLGKFPEWSTTLRRIARCRKSSSALLSAAVSYISDDADAAQALRLLTIQQKKPTDPHEYIPRDEDSFRASLLRCALRACVLGLNTEANALYEQASPHRYDFWRLSDPWPTHSILPWVLAVCVEAMLADRELTLFDFLPDQLWRLVDGQPVPQDLAEQRKVLDQALKADAPSEGPEAKREEAKPSRSQLSSSERHRVPERIKERVLPALQLGCCIVRLLKAKTSAERQTSTAAFFASWHEAQEAARKEVWSRDANLRFLDGLYSDCALQLLPSIAVLDQTTAELLEQHLSRSDFIYAPIRIQFVSLLVEKPECHTFAGRVAASAIKIIELEDEVQNRADLFARLARALLPANRTEANFLFKRGLTELDAIGSGDFDFMNELLSFAASVREPVAPAAALRLSKICELNNYDSDKFPWIQAAKAFSRVWGTKYLAQIARWRDRGKVDFDLTLPAAISFLWRDKAISPVNGILLLGLVEPVRMWDWGWPALFESLATVTDDVAVFEEMLDQFERAFPTGSYDGQLPEIRALLEKNPAKFSLLSSRLDRLESTEKARRRRDRDSRSSSRPITEPTETFRQEENAQAEIDAAITATDPLDPASLEALMEKIGEHDRALNAKIAAFQALWPRIAYSNRDKHIEAIALVRNLGLFEKNEILKGTKEAWQADSPSALAAVNSLAKRLVGAHADELISAEWGFTWELNKLAELTRASRTDLAIDLITEATSRNLSAAATTWLNLASLTSVAAEAAVPRRALERLLGDAAGRLADEIGDGAWRNELDPGEDQDEVVAGLIWFCLGSPEAVARWRAAHAVRACARMGQWSVITKLFSRLAASGAGAFQDQTIPFMVLHAKFWSLLAIARIALDFPSEIAKFAGFLEVIALDDAFPHVGLRQLAAKALGACLVKNKSSEAKAILERIASVNVSKFPRPKKIQYISGDRWSRPKDAPRPEPNFHFDYDFEKYDVVDLGRQFGMPQWEAGDRCVRWIKELSPSVTSMSDFAGRQKPNSDDYRAGTKDGFHSYGTYLAWHALALTAGELLLERPLARRESYEEPWDDFLSKYRITRVDGLWLSDGTDPYPARARDDLRSASSDARRPIEDENTLLNLARIGEDRVLGSSFIASGNWSSPDSVHVDISTSLVPADKADLVAVAVGTSPEFHMWLPTARAFEEEDDIHREHEAAPCKEWVSRREASAKLDGFDPFGSIAALQRDRLTMAINRAYCLASTDPWSASWSNTLHEIAYTAEAWGRHRGSDRSSTTDQGNTVTCGTDFLLEVLRNSDCNLLMLIRLELYIEKSRFSMEEESGSNFAFSWLTAIIDKNGNVNLVRPTDADRKIIEGLPDHDRYNLDLRFCALEKARAR